MTHILGQLAPFLSVVDFEQPSALVVACTEFSYVLDSTLPVPPSEAFQQFQQNVIRDVCARACLDHANLFLSVFTQLLRIQINSIQQTMEIDTLVLLHLINASAALLTQVERTSIPVETLAQFVFVLISGMAINPPLLSSPFPDSMSLRQLLHQLLLL